MYRYILLSICETEQMPSKAPGWPYNASRADQGTSSLDHISKRIHRDVERQERHVAEETMFRTRANCLCCPSMPTSSNAVISTFSQTNEFT